MLSVPILDNEVQHFVDYIFDGLTGQVLAPSLDRESNDFKHNWFAWPEERNALVNWLENESSDKEIYLAPAIWKERKLSKDTFKATNVAWTEFDGKLPEDTGSIPEPTCKIQSSTEAFQHWYWKLETPITDVTVIEAINRSLTYTLEADASAWDATQILRVPGTFNHKRGTPVKSLAFTTERVSVSLFDTIPLTPEPSVEVVFDTIPDVTDVVLKYPWPKHVIDLYKVRELPEGSRSSGLMKLGYCCAEMGMSDAEIFSVLRNADDRWKKFTGRKDRNQRLIDLIAKVRINVPQEIDLGDADVTPVYGYRTFLNTEVEIEWEIEGLLEKQGYMLLTGPAGVGKTQLSLQLARHLALGEPYLGLDIKRPTRVLFVSCEMAHPALKFFVATMSKDLNEERLSTLEQNLFFVPLGEPLYLDNQVGQGKFEELLEAIRPDGFIFDSIGSSTSGELSTESVVKTIMDFNDRTRNKYKVFSWFIHHNRKATSENKKPNKLADVYGNQYLVNRATSVYCLWPSGPNIEVIPLKKRLAPLEEPWQIVRTADLDFHKKTIPTSSFLSLAGPSKEIDSSGPSWEPPTPKGFTAL